MRKRILFVGLAAFFVLPMFGQEYFVNKSMSNHDPFDMGLYEHKDLSGGEIIDCSEFVSFKWQGDFSTKRSELRCNPFDC